MVGWLVLGVGKNQHFEPNQITIYPAKEEVTVWGFKNITIQNSLKCDNTTVKKVLVPIICSVFFQWTIISNLEEQQLEPTFPDCKWEV